MPLPEWNRENTFRLISEYQARRELWDPIDARYVSHRCKADLWGEVASSVGCTIEEAKRRMQSLLASLRREKARARKSLQERGEKYKSSWFAFEKLSFLPDRNLQSYQDQETSNDYTRDDSDSKLSLEELAARHAFSSSADLNELVQTTDSNGQIIIEGQNNGFVKQEVDDEERNPSTSTSKRRRVDNTDDMNQDNEDDSTNVNKRRRYTERRYIPANNRQTQQFNEWLQPSDDCLSFGRYIADKLRNYKYNTRCSVQHAISEVIFSADQGRFDTYFEDYVNDDNRKTEKSCDSQDHEGDENFLNDA